MIISGEDLIEMSGVETLHPGGFDLSRRIGELINFNSAMHILDVSSGKGIFASFYAKEFGCRVTGIDINQNFVSLSNNRAAKSGVADRVDFRVGDSRNLPFPDNFFDVVVNECAVGLTVINNPRQVLKEMVRVAKPGGKVVIHESIWLKELPDNEKKDSARKMGTTPYFMEEWKHMMASAGAAPEKIEDWSGIENFWKMRPDFGWNAKKPTEFLSWREKMNLLPKVISRGGIKAAVDVWKFSKRADNYLKEGYLGYMLMIAVKEVKQ